LNLNSDATYKFELNSATGLADQLVGNGVSLSNSALFDFSDLGAGTLAADGSVVFVIIDNTSDSAITGRFANLLDGAIFTANGNAYRASYTGGTGNDLTLTAVPEPGTFVVLITGVAALLGSVRRGRRG